MDKNIVYLTDEYLYLYNKKKDNIYKVAMPKNVIINGYVANINKFITKYSSILKEYNLNNGLIGEKIRIIVHPKYTPADITLLKSIFEKFNYRKITIENEVKYYKMEEKKAWIHVNNAYLLLTFFNEYHRIENILVEKNFFNSKEEVFQYIKSKIKDKDLYLIGDGPLLDEFYECFEEKFGNKTYTFHDSENYLFSCLKNL